MCVSFMDGGIGVVPYVCLCRRKVLAVLLCQSQKSRFKMDSQSVCCFVCGHYSCVSARFNRVHGDTGAVNSGGHFFKLDFSK